MMMQPPVTAPVNPIHRSIFTLDNDMRAVLDRADLSDDEKSDNTIKSCNVIWNITTISGPRPRHRKPKPSRMTKSSERFPREYKGKAENLLKRIEREPTMHWNERGESYTTVESSKGATSSTWWMMSWHRERVSTARLAGICSCSPWRQCTTRLDRKSTKVGLDASRICYLRCFFHSWRRQSRKVTS